MRRSTTSCGTATVRSRDDGTFEVLLVQPRQGSAFGFPKGHTEEGEDHMDTASRETLEETGVDVYVTPELLGSAVVLSKHERKTVFVYMAYPIDKSAKPAPLDGENVSVSWWPVSALPAVHKYQQSLFDALPQAVKRVFSDEG